MSSKHYRIFFYFFVVCILGGLIFVCYDHRASDPVGDRKGVSRNRHPRPRHEIRGFHYEANYKGKRTISIKADRFTIQKKKLGFFSFGLINEARLENAHIHIYGRGRLPGNNPDGSHNNVKLRQDLTFNGVFSRESLPRFPRKRISSILMEPVCVELHDEQSVVTQISASSAAIRLKKGDIVFKGDVRVVSGSRVLTTDQLSVLPEKAVIKTERHFMLKTPEKQWEGHQLTTDIFLRAFTL